MTTDSGNTVRGAWREWSQRHHILLSVVAHILLFAVAWFAAIGLSFNFRKSATLDFWPSRGSAPDASQIVEQTADGEEQVEAPPGVYMVDGRPLDWFIDFYLPLVIPVVLIKLIAFMIPGEHRASWRYVSLRDLFGVARGTWLAFAFVLALCYVPLWIPPHRAFGIIDRDLFTRRFTDAIFIFDFCLTIGLVCGARLYVRLRHEATRPSASGVAPRLLVIGAGNAGENAVREILRVPVLHYHVVGFLDDDRSKWGAQIHGIRVLGPIDNVREVCEKHKIDEILIAIPSATRARLRGVLELCQGTSLRFKTLPALADLIEGRASIKEIRDVDINDLLGRAPVKLDDEQIAQFIRGRVVMVTGAGGSIGSEMCRQVARFRPRRLVLVEQAEPGLFPIDQELRRSFPDIDFLPCIADICDAVRVDAIFARERPSAVFHAAAHKHVPMMEYNPGEAIKNNTHGTRSVADAASRHGCEKLVMISTDKAVNPTSIMGGTKRVAEKYIQALNARCETQFVTVRFGNVLDSSGSVIPIFKEQIARGGPVTVTHTDMVRYFMTIPEASQLVLQAASMGRGGEIFVLDMGEPVKIVDLAREMITLSGFRPEVDINIEFTGMRPGEKLYEELAIDGEGVSRTAHPKIGIWQNKPSDWDALVPAIDRLVADADGLSREQTRGRLKELVPEFHLDTPPPRPSPKAEEGDLPATGAEPAPA